MSQATRQQPRFQFSIRLAILGLTLCAAGLGVYQLFRPPPIRPITPKQAAQIRAGMTQRQVMQVLGSPHRIETHGATTQWAFKYLVTDELPDAHLEIVFDSNERAVELAALGVQTFASSFSQTDDPTGTVK
jgi:hypothetical protein